MSSVTWTRGETFMIMWLWTITDVMMTTTWQSVKEEWLTIWIMKYKLCLSTNLWKKGVFLINWDNWSSSDNIRRLKYLTFGMVWLRRSE